MDKRNKTALAYLLVGVAAAGRALLAVPENAAIQEVSLTVLALVGYLLLASKTRRPTVFGAAGLVLELILCGSQTGGAWARLAPALRAADLWLFWGAALVGGMLFATLLGIFVYPALYYFVGKIGRFEQRRELKKQEENA